MRTKCRKDNSQRLLNNAFFFQSHTVCHLFYPFAMPLKYYILTPFQSQSEKVLFCLEGECINIQTKIHTLNSTQKPTKNQGAVLKLKITASENPAKYQIGMQCAYSQLGKDYQIYQMHKIFLPSSLHLATYKNEDIMWRPMTPSLLLTKVSTLWDVHFLVSFIHCLSQLDSHIQRSLHVRSLILS